MKTYLKTFGRMFKRHATRLISVFLMVLVSVGFTAGIGMSTDKINYSISDYYAAQNVSDIIFMNTERAFSQEQADLLAARYNVDEEGVPSDEEDNVLRGGMLEFQVTKGKATVNGSEVVLAGLPDGMIRLYLFDCASPADLPQNFLTTIETYDAPAEDDGAIAVYAERSTVQLTAFDKGMRFLLQTTIETAQEVNGAPAQIRLDVAQVYRLAGTVLNPLHMAVRDDPSYTDDPASDAEEDMLDLTAVFYIFGENVVDTLADGTIAMEVGGELREFPLTDREVQIPSSELFNQLYITLPERDTYSPFTDDYDAYVDEEIAAVSALLAENAAEGTAEDGAEDAAPVYRALTLRENFSFASFHEYGKKIESIGLVLMVVFLFVTVLVVLSTMTRLLDEERAQIACLLTLGYSPTRIILKYVLFALIGTVIGGAAAVFAGQGLAYIIYSNFTWNFVLPPYSSHIAYAFYLITFAVVLVVTLASTAFAGYRMTHEMPATLLRPKTPKAGKKVFLERIPLIWNRFSFKYKSTMRNILRFMTRFLMTVVSVAFSTALVLAGLAVLDCCLFQNVGGTSMIAVAVIVLVFAALLNFVVIYTLTNINISERERELATLKVLGYFEKEVCGYIYREIYITSGIGIVFGIPFGCLLCLFVFNVMGFGSIPGIGWYVWVLAPVLAVVFTILVTLALRRKIVKIDMNNSLKAME